MIEFELASQQPNHAAPAVSVTVIGLGGAGANILDTIAMEGLPGAQMVALNTDSRALQSAMLGVKIQLGNDLTRGLGAGGDPELGAEAVRASEAEIREELRGQKMVFLCAGLGGGTGSGGAPLVARMAREEGAFVVVFAVMPFAFEGKRRLRQAEEALGALREEADALVTFDNDRLGEVVLPKKGIHEAFSAADKIVSQSIRAIINLVSRPGLIRIGMDELIAAVGRGDTRCLFGFGAAKGENRVATAVAAALKSPLLHKGELKARGRHVLVHVCGGPQMTFADVQELMQEMSHHLHEDAQILFGTGVDSAMGDQISVTMLTSLSLDEEAGVTPTSAPVAARVVPARTSAPHAPAPAPVAISEEAVIADRRAAEDELEASLAEIEAEEAMAEAPVAVIEVVEFAEVAENNEAEEEEEAVEAEAEAEAEERAEEEDEDEEVESGSLTPSHVEQGMTARQQAEAAAALERPFHLGRLTGNRPAPVVPSRTAVPPPKSLFFQSWRREEERREQSGPVEYEDMGTVSELDSGPFAAPPVAPVREVPPSGHHRPIKPSGRLSNFFARTKVDEEPLESAAPAAPDAVQQETFDETLRPASRGRFDKAEPTIEDGEDLDVPTFMRRKR